MKNYKLLKRYDGLSEEVEIGEILLDVGNLFSKEGVEFSQLDIEEHIECWEELLDLEIIVGDVLWVDGNKYEIIYYNEVITKQEIYLKSNLFKLLIVDYYDLNKLYLNNKLKKE